MSTLDPLPFRFWQKVNKTSSCWLWLGAKDSSGYGSFYYGGRVSSTHRLVYEKLVDSIPEGLCVLHRCDTPACVNPEHLFLGTQAENVQDCSTKGRRAVQTGENNHNATLTEELVRSIRALREKGLTVREISTKTNINKNTVNKVIYRQSWGHV